jgi:[protein-PII] uridylyltransferase
MRHVNVCAMSIDEPYVELGFIADDRQGLLAVVTAALAAARLKVVGAQIYSWKDVHGRVRALDLFWVRSGTDAKAALSTLSRIERDMERLMSQELSPAELVSGSARTSRWSDRPSPPVDTEVNIDNRAATDHTVIEVITRDRPALLFWLSNTLQHAGLSILLAKINTEGTQVADVFYVTDADGNKVSDPARIETLRAEILETIRRIEGTAYS